MHVPSTPHPSFQLTSSMFHDELQHLLQHQNLRQGKLIMFKKAISLFISTSKIPQTPSLCLSLSLSLSLCLSLCLCLSLSISLSLSHSLSLPLSASPCLSLCLSLCAPPPLSLSLSVSLCLSLSLTNHPLTQFVTDHTHKSGHILDRLIARTSDQLVASVSVTDNLSSDHFAVLSSLSLSKLVRRKRSVTRSNVTSIDMHAFASETLSVHL